MTKYQHKNKAILLLADGRAFYGKQAGINGTATGEICFNTGMTGYQEVFTDPSYFGQLMVATHVHIGNYGIKKDESESDGIKIAGLICRAFSTTYSRHSADEGVAEYFSENNIMAISDIDTRAVVRHIRSKGAMNAIISTEIFDIDELNERLRKCPSMHGLELASKVSTAVAYTYGNSNATHKVAVLDLGVKINTLRCLESRNCFVKVFPHDASFDEMQSWQPDGYLISNGPGDPSAMSNVVETIKNILKEDVPLFGICLGHQVIAEACGISTFKMFNGHRGINHPVKNLLSGKCEITSQNHGFAINKEEVDASELVEPTHLNLNDSSYEGIKVKNKKAFSVQYHPESAPGPHDSRYLFDEFINLITVDKKQTVNS